MSTIESLDLASLTNNPQSIAEALEDALETTSGTIGSLKTSAQDDHDHIEGLRTSAQSDHDDIENFLGITTAEHKHYTSGFLNDWQSWDWTTATSTEQGVRVRRMGLLYIVDITLQHTTMGIGGFNHHVLELDSSITYPSNTVLLGMNAYNSSSQEEWLINSYINTSGHLYLRGYNGAGTGMYLSNSFFGLDIAE